MSKQANLRVTDSFRVRRTFARLGFAACILVPVIACNFEQRDWKKAQKADTIEAYSAFLGKHSQGSFADQARREIEQREWKVAESTSTINAFSTFLGKHPGSEHADAAKKAIDVLERRAKLDVILAKHDMEALRSFVADGNNEGAIDRFKTAKGGTLTLNSQPEVLKGYRLQVKASKAAGTHDISVVIPSGEPLDKPFGFSGAKFSIARGARINIVNGQLKVIAEAGGLEVTTSLKDTSVVTLPFEYADIGPQVLLHVSDAEFLATRDDETALQRKLASKEFSVTKGNIYLLKLP